jgi:hypothetical protein
MILREGHFETINNYDFAWTDIQKPNPDLFIILNFPVNMQEEKPEYDSSGVWQ